MKHALRIAVLSDQHVDSKVDGDSWELAKKAFRSVARAKVDHAVIVGDLFDSSSAMLRDRAKVEQYLRRHGLWHRDRLSIVVGNHDVFHTAHRGTWRQRAAEFLKIATEDAQASYDAFTDWAGQLAHSSDRLDGERDLFPLEKKLGHVCIWAADTTAATTDRAGNGYWPKADDTLLRKAARNSNGERRVLAMHHPVYLDEEQTIRQLLKGDFCHFGFPPAEFRRLKRFLSDARVDVVVAGHIHADDQERWSWKIGGSKSKTEVRLCGRTGGVHGATPCFGLLEVPEQGALTWREIKI
jgi:predicted phosphodiesterase